MITRYVLLISFLLLIFSKVNAQEYGKNVPPSFGVVAGYSGFQNNFIELGVGYQPWEVEGTFVYYPFAGFMALVEVDPYRRLYGNNLNAWYLSGPISLGLNANRY